MNCCRIPTESINKYQKRIRPEPLKDRFHCKEHIEMGFVGTRNDRESAGALHVRAGRATSGIIVVQRARNNMEQNGVLDLLWSMAHGILVDLSSENNKLNCVLQDLFRRHRNFLMPETRHRYNSLIWQKRDTGIIL